MADEISCISEYECGEEIHPLDGAVYTPYVELTIGGKVVLLSGNESSPEVKNRAAIQSFQYGTTMGQGGCGIKVEIVDEGGELYRTIVKGLNADITKALSAVTGVNSCKAKFGWWIKDCSGATRLVTNEDGDCNSTGGGELWFIPKNIQTTFDNGIVKFIFEAQDLFTRSFDARLEKNIGDESNKVDLKTALRDVYTTKDPTSNPPIFLNKDKTGDFEFAASDGGKDGPKSVWAAEQESNVSCSRKWLNSVKTKEGRGVLIEWDPCNKRITFQEDPVIKECCDKNLSIGTFVVNGGNMSPVLSFAPQVEWPLGANAGSGGTPAGSSSGNSGEDVKSRETEEIQNTGTQTSQNIPNDQDLWRDPTQQGEKTMTSMSVQNDANKPWEGMIKAIEGELKIFGNPKYVNAIFYTGRWMSIVVIDPYYFEEGGGTNASISGGSCTWISEPGCNPILSNKKWMILGVDHQISSGSFVTTFKVKLAVPNVNIPGGEPLGGCGNEFADESDSTEPRK